MSAMKMRLVDWLDDLCVRFIINLPQEELESVERICFQVEEAQWFYEDFVRPLDPTLPSLNLKKFCLLIFQHCPLLSGFSPWHHIAAYEEFLTYKTRVPVRGLILLNDAMDQAVLVKGWKKGARWSFPRGKINKDEDDLDCAIREVDEETGFDARLAGLVPSNRDVKYIEVSMREQQIRLYVIRGVPMNTFFAPKTRKEISKIDWYKLSDLPTLRKRTQNNATSGDEVAKASQFYMVTPFLGPLKTWIKEQRRRDRKMAQSTGKRVALEVTDIERGDPSADEHEADRAHMERLLARIKRPEEISGLQENQPSMASPAPQATAALKQLLSVGLGAQTDHDQPPKMGVQMGLTQPQAGYSSLPEAALHPPQPHMQAPPPFPNSQGPQPQRYHGSHFMSPAGAFAQPHSAIDTALTGPPRNSLPVQTPWFPGPQQHQHPPPPPMADHRFAAPTSSSLPPPALSAHSMNLLSAFRVPGSSLDRSAPQLRVPEHQIQPTPRTQVASRGQRPSSTQLDLVTLLRGDVQPPAPPPAVVPKTHQQTLLDMFKSKESTVVEKSTSPISPQPVELSAMPMGIHEPAVLKPPPTLQQQTSRSRAKRSDGTGATLSGPPNEPEFAAVQQRRQNRSGIPKNAGKAPVPSNGPETQNAPITILARPKHPTDNTPEARSRAPHILRRGEALPEGVQQIPGPADHQQSSDSPAPAPAPAPVPAPAPAPAPAAVPNSDHKSSLLSLFRQPAKPVSAMETSALPPANSRIVPTPGVNSPVSPISGRPMQALQNLSLDAVRGTDATTSRDAARNVAQSPATEASAQTRQGSVTASDRDFLLSYLGRVASGMR